MEERSGYAVTPEPLNEETLKIEEAKNEGVSSDSPGLEVKNVPKQLPPHAVFRPGEVFPMRGFNFMFLGYTKGFELVFKSMGMTGKKLKTLKKGNI